jgi:hypothetical protein
MTSSARNLRQILSSTLSLTNYYAAGVCISPFTMESLRRALRDTIVELESLEAAQAVAFIRNKTQ